MAKLVFKENDESFEFSSGGGNYIGIDYGNSSNSSSGKRPFKDFNELIINPNPLPDINIIETNQSYTIEPYYKNLPKLNFICKSTAKFNQMEGDLINNYVPFHNLVREDSLCDFETENISVDVDHPCDIVIQETFDGSVNVIFSDDLNKPRLINSRFSVAEDSTFIIPDHFGDKDSNLYQDDVLDSDTSLYKTIDRLPKLNFNGLVTGGSMKCGSYYFAFVLCDNDENETDIVAESGLVQCHIGDLNDPFSMRMGLENENTQKGISFTLENLDGAYNYVKVMYSRRTSGKTGNDSVTFHKILHKFEVINNKCDITIWGHEDIKDITIYDFNPKYDYLQQVKSITDCENRLFFGNVYKQKIPYEELQEFSWHLQPYIKRSNTINNVDECYNSNGSQSNLYGYYNMNNVYNYTGYWPDEYYRFGIVYIFKDYSLSPVFNTLGVDFSKIEDGSIYSAVTTYQDIEKSRQYGLWQIDEDGYFLNQDKKYIFNNFGLCRFPKEYMHNSLSNPIGVGFKYHKAAINVNEKSIAGELDKELEDKIKNLVLGCFIVRQKRKPLILAQGITIGKTLHGYGDLPVLRNYNKDYFTESFLSDGYDLKGNNITVDNENVQSTHHCMLNKLGSSNVKIKNNVVETSAAIIPAVNMHEATYNAIFNSNEFLLQPVASIENMLNSNYNYYPSQYKETNTLEKKFKLTVINTNRGLVTDGTNYFSTKAGDENDIKKFSSVTYDWKATGNPHANESDCGGSMFGANTGDDNHITPELTSDKVIRGIYGTYVGLTPIEDKSYFPYGTIFNVRPGDYEDTDIYHYAQQQIRKQDTSQYSAISERMLFDELFNKQQLFYRGDCFICPYTHRMQRNFVDPEFPTNDTILEPTSWMKNFMVQTTFKGKDSLTNKNVYINQVLNQYKIKTGEHASQIGAMLAYCLLGIPILTEDQQTVLKTGIDNTGSTPDINIIPNTLKGIIVEECTKVDDDHDKHLSFKKCEIVLPDHPKYGKKGSIMEAMGGINLWKELGAKDINRSDVNAVNIGHWFTFMLLSNDNLCLRDIDIYHPEEQVQFNHPRSFYPLEKMNKSSEFKCAESQLINGACNTNMSDRMYFTMPDVPYIKQQYDTRICYSELHVPGEFRNGFRVVGEGSHFDYPKQCGTLVCIKELKKHLVGIMEHGVMLIPISERIASGTGSAGPVYMRASNILSHTPLVIDNNIGSIWKESIIESQLGVIYGIDTIAKKIWYCDGQSVKILSDFKVGRFLNENMNLTEWDKAVKLGFKRVKTYYNAFKNDVMFSFQNDTTEWVLCYNEQVNAFTTFYSWRSTFMENINNIPLSFDDEVTKNIIYTQAFQEDKIKKELNINLFNFNRNIPEMNIFNKEINQDDLIVFNSNEFSWIQWPKYLLDDPTLKKAEFLNYLDIVTYNGIQFIVYKGVETDETGEVIIDSDENWKINKETFKQTIKKLNELQFLNFYLLSKDSTSECNLRLVAKTGKSHYIWKHGEAGIFRQEDGERSIKSTKWYGRQYPFEFEFICNGDIPDLQKIFNNISIISNKAAPNSFEYTVDGEGYEWFKYKPLILWIENYLEKNPKVRKKDLYYHVLKQPLSELRKSEPFDTIPPLPFVDENKKILKLPYLKHIRNSDSLGYKQQLHDSQYSENTNNTWLTEDALMNQYKVKTEQKALDIRKYGRLKGNCQYLEDNWKIEIRPITFRYVYLNNNGQISFTKDSTQKIRDKYIRIKIKYSGEDLAVISAVKTLYTESYA